MKRIHMSCSGPRHVNNNQAPDWGGLAINLACIKQARWMAARVWAGGEARA